jgi:hypothetical protein
MAIKRPRRECHFPLILVMLAVLIDTASHTLTLASDRMRLDTTAAAQAQENTGVLQAEYDAIIGGTVNLVKQGHKNVLRKRPANHVLISE